MMGNPMLTALRRGSSSSVIIYAPPIKPSILIGDPDVGRRGGKRPRAKLSSYCGNSDSKESVGLGLRWTSVRLPSW